MYQCIDIDIDIDDEWPISSRQIDRTLPISDFFPPKFMVGRQLLSPRIDDVVYCVAHDGMAACNLQLLLLSPQLPVSAEPNRYDTSEPL